VDRLTWLKVFFVGLLLLGLCASAFAAEQQPEKEFGGVGLQVVPTVSGQLVVLGVVPDGPAATAGLQPGDLIYQVNNFKLQGSEFADVVAKHLWGPIGSDVSLHYLRPGIVGPHTVSLRRTEMQPRLTVSPAVQEEGRE